MNNLKKFKLKILFLIFVIISIVSYTRYVSQKENLEEALIEKIATQNNYVNFSLDSKLKEMIISYKIIIYEILTVKEVKQSIKNGNKKELAQSVNPFFKMLQKENLHLKILNFYDSKNNALIRFDKQNQHNNIDFNKMPLLKKAFEVKKEINGFEIGYSDSSSAIYKIIVPIVENGNYLGMVELGIEIEYLINSVSKEFKNIYKNKKDNFSLALLMDNEIFASGTYEKLGRYFIVYSDDIFKEYVKYIDLNKNQYIVVTKNSTYWLDNKSEMILDYNNEKNINVVFGKNITKEFQRHKEILQEEIIKSIITIVLLIVVLNYFLNILIKRYNKNRVKLHNSYGRSNAIINSQKNIIIILDEEKIVDANRAFLKFFEIKDLNSFFKKYQNIYNLFIEKEDSEYLCPKLNGNDWIEHIVRNPNTTHRVAIAKNGVEHIFIIELEKFFNITNKVEYIVVFTDITTAQKQKKQLTDLAYLDHLTNIPNRAKFNEVLSKLLSFNRKSSENISLLFLDLDGFKKVNDSYGHDYGDELLKQVAIRLKNSIRDTDFVARLGGDEFVIIAKYFENSFNVGHLAQKIIDTIDEPFNVFNKVLYIGASIGISVYPKDGESAKELVKNGDIAMYHAKETGKNRYIFYDHNLGEKVFQMQEMEQDMKKALSDDEFYLVYQPFFDLKTDKVVGIEAFIRWKHPHKGEIYPGQFIPIAESSDLILSIGQWIFKQISKEVGSILKLYNLKISINIANRQFKQPGFEDYVIKLINDSDLDPKQVEPEIIEKTALEDSKHTRKILESLSLKGVNISLDDFGTGYSSLSYLNEFSLQKIKIDRSFISNILHDKSSLSIVKTIIILAKSMEITAVAEGVETQEEHELLRELECDIVQGNYLCKPLILSELQEYLKH